MIIFMPSKSKLCLCLNIRRRKKTLVLVFHLKTYVKRDAHVKCEIFPDRSKILIFVQNYLIFFLHPTVVCDEDYITGHTFS